MIVYRTNWIVDKPKDGLCYLRLRVKWCRSNNILSFMLPFKIDPTKWVQSAQRLKPNTTHGKHHIPASDINRKMQEYEQCVAKIFSGYDITPPTKEAVRTEFEQMNGKSVERSPLLTDLLDKYIAEQQIESLWTAATQTKFNTLRHHIDAYKSNMTADTFNADTMRGMLDYYVKTGYRNSYIQHMLGVLKAFLRWAANNGYIDSLSFESFHPRLKGSEGNSKAIVYLTWDELQTFYNFQFPKDYLRRVRDVFCLCAFSGLRYSDAAKLRWRDITDTSIFVVTQKTTEALTIELNDYTKEILNRYRSDYSEALALPVISNQKYNKYLKEAAKMAGLDATIKSVYYIGNQRYETNCPKYELLSSHAARRTFVVNALFLGISPEVIMKWTGHSNYEAMKPYVDIVDELKANEMAKFNRH